MKRENNSIKLTGKSWAHKFNIKFIDLKGFPSPEYFNKVATNIEDFTGFAALCEVEKPEIVTRRDANKLKKTLNWNLQ